MFAYTAYGLTIHSDVFLPELLSAAASSSPDIRIRVGPIPDRHAQDRQGCVRADADEALLFWKVFGTCCVRGGTEIVADPIDDVDEGILRLVLEGVALGILLHQRGIPTLHASAVALGGQAVLFLGPKGMGKSTAAAAMHAAGHTLVADDVSAILWDGPGSLFVLPGIPRLNLWPDVVEWLGSTPGELQRLQAHLEKRNVPVARRFSGHSVPLCAAFVLADGPEIGIEPLPPRKAVVELVRNSYALRFLGTAGTSAAHFQQCVRTADTLPLFQLMRPRDLQELSTFVAAVEDRVRGLKPETSRSMHLPDMIREEEMK